MRSSTHRLYVSLLHVSLLLAPAILPAVELAPTVSTRAEVLKARGYLASGEYGKAETSLRQALASAADADAARTVQNALADLLHEEGRVAEARQIYNEVLNGTGVSPRQKIDSLSGMADLDGMSGDTELAAGEWGQAIAIAREIKNPTAEADATRGLGMTWLDAGNLPRAEPLLRRALKMMDDDPASTPWETASALACLGRCYRMQNKLALAEDALTRALDLNRKSYGPTHPQVAYVMERLAEVYALRNQFVLARDYSSRALAVMRASCGENSAAVAAALVNRASIEQHANAPEAALENYAAALKIVQSNPQEKAQNSLFEAQIMERYAAVLKLTHHDREAKDLNAQAKSFRSELR